MAWTPSGGDVCHMWGWNRLCCFLLLESAQFCLCKRTVSQMDKPAAVDKSLEWLSSPIDFITSEPSPQGTLIWCPCPLHVGYTQCCGRRKSQAQSSGFAAGPVFDCGSIQVSLLSLWNTGKRANKSYKYIMYEILQNFALAEVEQRGHETCKTCASGCTILASRWKLKTGNNRDLWRFLRNTRNKSELSGLFAQLVFTMLYMSYAYVSETSPNRKCKKSRMNGNKAPQLPCSIKLHPAL